MHTQHSASSPSPFILQGVLKKESICTAGHALTPLLEGGLELVWPGWLQVEGQQLTSLPGQSSTTVWPVGCAWQGSSMMKVGVRAPAVAPVIEHMVGVGMLCMLDPLSELSIEEWTPPWTPLL